MEKPLNACSPSEEFARLYVRPRAGRTLIVGSLLAPGRADRRAAFADALGVDMRDGPGVDRVLDLEEPLAADLGLFDHVECVSVLEHSRRPWLLAANLERLLVPGGTLHLSVPFVWGLHLYPGDHFRFTATGVQLLFPAIRWQALRYAGGSELNDGGKTARRRIDGNIFVERTLVLGFGVNAC